MQSFELAPQAASENQKARVKPFNERKRQPRFVDEEERKRAEYQRQLEEEEKMPDTKRSRNQPASSEQPKEDVKKVEEIQEQIKKPETSENEQTLAMYSDASIKRARNALGQLNMAARTNALTGPSFQDFRNKLLTDRNYLMELQQYTLTQPRSEGLRKIQESIYQNIVDIQEGIYNAEQTLRQQAVAQNLGMQRQGAVETPSNTRREAPDTETAALANKFASSAKKMEAQKKSVWGRIKSWFS